MMKEFEIGGQKIKPGTRGVVRMMIAQDLDGGDVAVHAHVLHGSRPGPTLGLLTVQCGFLWGCLVMHMRALTQLDPGKIAGTVISVPVCSPTSLGTGKRLTQPESDHPDLSYNWPGVHNDITDLIAKTLTREVVEKCDALLDFRSGIWGMAGTQAVYATDYPDPQVGERCHELSVAYGPPSISRGLILAPPPKKGSGQVMGPYSGVGTVRGYAGARLGIPVVILETGGVGFSTEREENWIKINIRGIKNVMRHLGMLDEPIEKSGPILLTRTRTQRIGPTVGGLLAPELGPDRLITKVRKGELMGRIISPYTFRELERLESPYDGYMCYVSRFRPVSPGDYAFGVFADTDCEWITQ